MKQQKRAAAEEPIVADNQTLWLEGGPERTVAVMQPYFFPYGGYFALIQAVDLFILDDLAQYTPKRWMNRNRIRCAVRPAAVPEKDVMLTRTQKSSWQYLTLPVQHCPVETPICRVLLAPEQWRQKMYGKLTVYAGAAYYRQTMALWDQWMTAVEALPEVSLAEANALGLELVCQAIGLHTPMVRLSVLRAALPAYQPPYPKGQNALAVCLALGQTAEYRNLPGGMSFYPREPYRRVGIRLRFQEWLGMPNESEPFLSILDLMMRYSAEEIRTGLKRIRLWE